jgi:hypothetical protein
MPKCRSCSSRVGKNQPSCFRCGIWCPDQGALNKRIALFFLIILALVGLLFLTAREQMSNAEKRYNQEQN